MLRRFKLDGDKIWQDCSSSECASIDGVGFSIWRRNFKTAATTSLHAEKCRHLASKHEATVRMWGYAAAYVSYWSIVHSIVIERRMFYTFLSLIHSFIIHCYIRCCTAANNYTVSQKTRQTVLLDILRINFDDIWQKYPKGSRIEFACFSFRIGLLYLSTFRLSNRDTVYLLASVCVIRKSQTLCAAFHNCTYLCDILTRFFC